MSKETVEIATLMLTMNVRVCARVDVKRCLQAAGEDDGEFGFGPPEMRSQVEWEIERFLNAQPYIFEAQVGDTIERLPSLPVQLSLPFDDDSQ